MFTRSFHAFLVVVAPAARCRRTLLILGNSPTMGFRCSVVSSGSHDWWYLPLLETANYFYSPTLTNLQVVIDVIC